MRIASNYTQLARIRANDCGTTRSARLRDTGDPVYVGFSAVRGRVRGPVEDIDPWGGRLLRLADIVASFGVRTRCHHRRQLGAPKHRQRTGNIVADTDPADRRPGRGMA